jgi:acyl-CoA reductase-like NAD-dependent aldehyde dehydrogenase
MQLHQTTQFIDGEFVESSSDATIDVICPSTEEVVGAAPDAGSADLDRACQAARRSFDRGEWRRLPMTERADLLDRALDLLQPRLDEIGITVTTEMGVPISIAGQLMPMALSTGRFFTDAARSLELVDVRAGTTPAAVVREPIGVVAAITPWNGPFNMMLSKVIPALVSGCSVVFKPAPETPIDAYYLAEALHDVGLPAGVFNLITGGRDIGAELVTHRAVDKVSFTGSTAAGRWIGEQCGRTFTRMQLELGGKSAAIVLDDADLGKVATAIASGTFFNTGQVCAALSRVLVPRAMVDDVSGALAAAGGSFVIGDPFEPTTTLGPLVSERQRDRVEGYIAKGVDEGGHIVSGGGRPESIDRGWFIEPTVFVGLDNSSTLAQEEIFGPVVTVIPHDGIDHAIELANQSDYGLHGAVFTEDPVDAAHVARGVRTGTFSINSFVYNIEAPFGGVKCSGVGRDTGLEGLLAYYELKTVNLDGNLALDLGQAG